MNIIWVGIGGFIGAIARYGISTLVYRVMGRSSLPIDTLAVNILGSFILGFFMFYGDAKWAASTVWRNFIAVGIMGALTTFSTFSYETFGMLNDNLYGEAIINILLNVLLTIAAVWLGMTLAKAL